ncbi:MULTISPECIES: hypothetical protein [Paraburkholderia]|uniref:Polyhydroxyalkanoate depolymerase n=1 Tax=Paraburkholderia dioscoreae TaxID=2604047 RepID=A0A5Q4ZCP3_9BURK
MWYAWLEAQRNLMRLRGTWRLPASDGNPQGADEPRVAAMGYDWIFRLIQPPPEAPPFGIATIRIGEHEVPVVEQVIERTPFCTLRKFSRAPDAGVLLPEI